MVLFPSAKQVDGTAKSKAKAAGNIEGGGDSSKAPEDLDLVNGGGGGSGQVEVIKVSCDPASASSHYHLKFR